MSRACRIVKEPEDLAAMARVLRSSKTVNDIIRRVPQVGMFIRTVFGSSADLTKGNVARGAIAHARLIEERQTATVAALSSLYERPIHEVFDISEEGLVKVGLKTGRKKVTVGINDIIEHPNRYRLNVDQIESIRHRLSLKEDFVDYYNRFAEHSLSRDESLFPRRVAGLVDSEGVHHPTYGTETEIRQATKKLKQTGRFNSARAENPKTGQVMSQSDMIQKGYRYLDPDLAFQEWAQEVSKATADAQFIRWAEKNLAKEGILRTRKQVVGKAKTGVFPVQPAEKFGGTVDDGVIRVSKFDSERVPGLGKFWAPQELVDYYTELLERPPRVEIPFLTRLSDEARVAIASFDASVTGIQLLVGGLGSDLGHLGAAIVTANPSRATATFPKAVYAAVRAMFDKGMPDRYFTENLDFINRWAPFMGGLRSSDYFDVLQRRGGGKDYLKFFHQAQQPFARGFEFALDLAKIEQLKSWERIMKAANREVTPDMMEAMGAWARNSVGATSVRGLGMSPTQLGIEGTFLWFSQRYTRSLFATVGTIFETGVAGHEARLALGGLATGGLLVYMAAAEALGQTPNLDPHKPGFMSIRVGNTWVGLGGGYRALTRLMINSYKATRDDPTKFVEPDMDNPLFAFWRSRTTPVTSGVLDIWAGTDFAGRPIEGVTDWERFIRERTLTFNIQSALDAKGSLFNRVGIGLLATFGASTNPMTERQQYDWYLKSITSADGTQRFPDGVNTVNTDENQFHQFVRIDPMAKNLKDEYEDSRLRRGKTGREIQKTLNVRAERLAAAEENLRQTGDYYQYRSHVNQIRADTRQTMEAMNLEFTPQTEDKKLVQSWYDTYNDPRAVDVITGGIDSEGLEQAQDEWKRANPGVYERLIEPNESLGETPMETELRSERSIISDAGWWDTDDVVWQQLVEITSRRRGRIKLGKYKDYRDYILKRRQELEQQLIERGMDPGLATLRADIKLRSDPVLAKFSELRTRERMILQRQNPDLVFLLQKWGYSTTSLQEYKIAKYGLNNEGLLG